MSEHSPFLSFDARNVGARDGAFRAFFSVVNDQVTFPLIIKFGSERLIPDVESTLDLQTASEQALKSFAPDDNLTRLFAETDGYVDIEICRGEIVALHIGYEDRTRIVGQVQPFDASACADALLNAMGLRPTT